MAEQKKKRIQMTSPKGVAKYPHLTKPQTEINGKPVEPTYGLGILVDPNDPTIIAFREKIEAAHSAAFLAAKKEAGTKKTKDEGVDNIFRDDVKKDEEGNLIPTGKLEIRFKCRAGGKRKDGSTWSFRPFVYDSKGVALPADTLVYGGSVVQVSFNLQHNRMETGSFYTKVSVRS
jgi:hypothetical protein